jgi:hypothetical protein
MSKSDFVIWLVAWILNITFMQFLVLPFVERAANYRYPLWLLALCYLLVGVYGAAITKRNAANA